MTDWNLPWTAGCRCDRLRMRRAFTRPEGMDGFVNVRATMLDDHAWYAPFVETSRAEGFPWATTGAPHSFPNIPPPEAFGPIVADFQQRGPRPR